MRYFITFQCYGSYLHGEEPGSVDRKHNPPGNRLLKDDPTRAAGERLLMKQLPYLLDPMRRACVLGAIREVCSYRGWNLLAAHVRMGASWEYSVVTSDEAVRAAIRYVVEEQGEPMALFVGDLE